MNALVGLLVVMSASACNRTPASIPEFHAMLAGDAAHLSSPSPEVWSDLQRFYADRAQALAWVSSKGPTEHAARALDTLHAARDHGLDPDEYGGASLRALHAQLKAGGGDDDPDRRAGLARFELAITASLLRLARHVATGRLDPAVVDERWNARREAPDYVAALHEAASGDVASLLDAVRPRHPEYAALQQALASLRAQAARGWPEVPRAGLKPGTVDGRVVPVLRQRLSAPGYLPSAASLDAPAYDEDVVAGVKAFQEHHGLPPTGTLDAVTLQRMNVPLDTRIEQVALNLERWRWMPDELGARHLFVNVPHFHLIARENGVPVMDIRVVVGKRGNETPLFTDVMETVVFSPYWNVPETIALEETAPAVARDPEYLSRNNMEVIDAAGNVVPAELVAWEDASALERLRFRQRPGPDNALGNVKFLFPNEHAVYLHDTPADALFKRIGRAFSHGCVRVEEPERLAQYVLRDQPRWTSTAIRAAMRSGEERHVKLTTPLPVHIVYFTAGVDARGGLHFHDDVYDYDERQREAQAAGEQPSLRRSA